VQVVLSSLHLCRVSSLAGPAHRWRAFAWLQHLRSSVYALPNSAAAAPEADAHLDDIPLQTDFFGRVLERCKVCIEGIDVPETLNAIQSAVYELDEWHQVLATEDSLACMRHAIVVGCENFLTPDAVSHVLSATVDIAKLDTFIGECHVTQGAGHVSLELQLIPLSSDPRVDLWGAVMSSDMVEPCSGRGALEHEVQQLLEAVLPALQERLRDVQGVQVEATVACAGGTSIEAEIPAEKHLLSVCWRVDAFKAGADAMEHVVVCAADLIRCACSVPY
jgi:hypothetical protein